ncbi:hypothetical protein FNF27_02576 [Cafeteria roenbergensis]|uniref:Methyltransferase type 11 domain-containing protein n=1 Tax=Cafeteria roenbergensis TaxID=33653 RepID=A0A5A8EDB7_CAFRO|nr:hypothetical protein FNF27_02576 [Cafeteria roenbergensis]
MAAAAAAIERVAAHKLFQHGAEYAAHRPTYPTELFARLADAVRSGPRSLAVDLGTGTGQALPGLLEHFERVVALEPSAGQLEAARAALPADAKSRVTLRQVGAEAIETGGGVPAGSADLVVAFQAAHWFQLHGESAERPGVYASAARALRPGGVVALVGYGNCVLHAAEGSFGADGASSAARAEEVANAAVRKLYKDDLGAHWDERRGHIDAHYVGLEPRAAQVAEWDDSATPSDGGARSTGGDSSEVLFTRCWREEDLSIRREMSVAALAGYLSTWSAYKTFKREQPDAPDPIAAARRSLDAAFGDRPVVVEWPLFAIMAERA